MIKPQLVAKNTYTSKPMKVLCTGKKVSHRQRSAELPHQALSAAIRVTCHLLATVVLSRGRFLTYSPSEALSRRLRTRTETSRSFLPVNLEMCVQRGRRLVTVG